MISVDSECFGRHIRPLTGRVCFTPVLCLSVLRCPTDKRPRGGLHAAAQFVGATVTALREWSFVNIVSLVEASVATDVRPGEPGTCEHVLMPFHGNSSCDLFVCFLWSPRRFVKTCFAGYHACIVRVFSVGGPEVTRTLPQWYCVVDGEVTVTWKPMPGSTGCVCMHLCDNLNPCEYCCVQGPYHHRRNAVSWGVQ